MKKVVKVDGRKEDFDIEKIRKQIIPACEGTNINPLEFESMICLDMTSNIKSSEIQEKLIMIAKNSISDENPDWDIVAGRLMAYQLMREIWKSTKFDISMFKEHIKYLIRNQYYRSDILKNFTDEQLDTLSNFIKEERDYNLRLSQVALLKSKYLVKNKKGIIEYPSTSDMFNSMILATIEEEKNRVSISKEYYEMLSKYILSLATPFKRNLRIPNGNTGSCFIGEAPDNIYGLMKSYTDMAYISQEGGGIGWYFGKIRPSNAYSRNVPKANKINKWLKIVNDLAVSVNQRGARVGAITVALDWWHMDIIDFCEIKSELNGDLRDKCFDIFPQIVVDTYFVEKVQNKEDVYLFDQHEYKQLTGKDITELIEEELYEAHLEVENLIKEGKLKHYEKISASKVWKQALWSWVEYGDFYITHKDNLNLSNYMKAIGTAKNANLCVTPETKILTKNGYKEIGSLEGTYQTIWNGEEWSENVKIVKTGQSQEILKVMTSTGFIECTPYHKFYIKKEGHRNPKKAVMKRAYELKSNDKIIKYSLPEIKGKKVLPFAYENGFFSGDGTYSTGVPLIYLYHDKTKLRNRFNNLDLISDIYYPENKKQVLRVKKGQLKSKYFIPNAEYTIKSRIDWLSGFLDADGCLTSNNGTQSLQVAQVNIDFLYELRLMLQTLGIDSKVTHGRDKGVQSLPKNDGSGEYAEYEVKEVKRLLIPEGGVQKLLSLGLSTDRLSPTIRKPNRDASQFIKVLSVENEGRVSDTYCFFEPKRNMGMFNGILAGNCVESYSLSKAPSKWKKEVIGDREVTTESDGLTHSCNLISINVANILNDNKLLQRACKNAVRMLDASIDLGTMPTLEAENSSKLLRNIGIGVVGLADWMAYNKVNYDSQEGRDLAEGLQERITYYCYQASIDLAKEKGSYLGFKDSDYSKMFGKTPEELNKMSKNGFDWVQLRKDIEDYGIRNMLLIALAPNTSSGLVQGVTASYLPAHSKNNTQTLGDMVIPVLPKFIDKRFWFYKTKFQYKTEDIIKFTRVLQRWVDTGISMELTINPDLTPDIKTISDEILEGFASKELKAVYYSLTIDAKKYECEGCAN